MEYVNIGVPGGLNGYQRRLIHQLLRSEFPAFRAAPRNDGEFMHVTKVDASKDAQVLFFLPKFYIYSYSLDGEI